MSKLFFFLLSLATLYRAANGQVENLQLGNPFFSEADSQKIFFRFENKDFFKNNEYFNPLYEGYTLLGYVAQPSFVYHPGKNTRIEAGANFLKYSGRDGFSGTQPVFRFQYQPAPYFQMVMGTLYGGGNHGLIEMFYRWERDFTNPVENGLQFLFATPQLKADVWLQWEKFIFKKDPFQEKLTVGTVASWNLLPMNERFNITIPFQALINHHGGQDISIDQPIRTIADYASGAKASLRNGNKIYKGFDVECWVMGYRDLSPQKLQAYRDGYGVYPLAKIFLSGFIMQAGYFHGKKLIAPQGESLYHSAAVGEDSLRYRIKDMVAFKFVYRKKIDRGISLAAYVETYTNLGLKQTDYGYGVHIIFDRDFFIAKLK